MARFIEDRSECTLFVNGSLDSLLPADALARVIYAALCELDFTVFEAAYANDAMGRPAVDPRRLAGVWIVGFLRGFSSSVALARVCEHDIEFRWLLGDAPARKSTLSDFRTRHLEALAELSTQLLAALARSGQLPGRSLVLDGTMVDAASSCGANASRKQLKKRLKRLKQVITDKLAEPEEDEGEIGPLEAHHPSAFTHDAPTNTLTCPAGETLRPIGHNQNNTSVKYRAAASACAACPEKDRCCPKATSGRTVHRSLHSELIESLEDHLQTPDGKRMLHARQTTSEGTFARLIGLLHWRRCRTWGRRGAQAEALWRQIAHNLMLFTKQWQPLVLKPRPEGE